MPNYKQHCIKLLQILDTNWPSGLPTTWEKWANAARADLAKPEPDGPSDEELLRLTQDWPCTTGERHNLSGCLEVPLFSVFEDELIDFARAVLARWGNHQGILDSSTPQPVPVSERLPGPEDCDAEGECY